MPREFPPLKDPSKQCDTNLFLGFFFDGTRNNYERSSRAGDFTHSNVARLYGAYPGQHVPGIPEDPEAVWTTNPANYKEFFKVYVPGVGTPFAPVGDSGSGKDATLGSAGALYGERRIIWALVQAIHCVYRYFYRAKDDPGLFYPNEILDFCKTFNLGRSGLLEDGKADRDRPARTSSNRALLTALLTKLHTAIRLHMIDPETGQCRKVDPGRVQRVFVSAFGFSRGAAEARVFVNWFLLLCEIDAQLSGQPGPTLGSFPVTFDFLGIFDTVASVGIAASSLFADGHGSWADVELSLRVPAPLPCLHLVAAHEFRRSFPLDSIHVGDTLPSNSREWVLPGMHSDIGGGYAPTEQGKGVDRGGSDTLSRIALAWMYREGRLAGVPLKLELARPAIKEQFRIDPGLIRDFKEYLEACRVREGPLHDIMAEQRKLYILWRKSCAGRVRQSGFGQRASREDLADLESADRHFVEVEMPDFEMWLKKRTSRDADDPNARAPGAPGLNAERADEWKRIAAYWSEPPPTRKLFEDRVHDSHAWFKLSGYEAVEFKAEMEKLVLQKKKEDSVYQMDPAGGSQHALLNDRQREWVELYLATGEYAPGFTEGREWYRWGAGYLRYRRIYAGSDGMRLTRDEAPGSQPVLAMADAQESAAV